VRLPNGWRLALALTAVTFCLSACWALLTPIFHAPDEPEHYDLISALASDPHYPEYDQRGVDPTIDDLAQAMLNSGGGSRAPHLGAATPPAVLGTANLSDPPTGAVRPASNQMPQHPPLYYESMAAALRTMRLLDPGSRAPSIASEVVFLRLLNAAIACTIPAAAMAALRLLSSRRTSGIAAGLACLAVPQFSHISGSINNDNLMNLLAAWSIVSLLWILRRGLTLRSAVVAGLLVGLGAMTKAFGLLLVPLLVLVFLVALIRSRDRGRALRFAAFGGVVAAVLGGWFWLSNVISHGSMSPTTFFDRAPTRPDGSVVDHRAWLDLAVRSIPERFWLSAGRYSVTFPDAVWKGLTVAGIALVVGGLVRLIRGGRWIEALVALAPFVLTLLYVLQHAHSIYVRTTWTSFLQGRYLFVGIAGLAAVAGAGLPRVSNVWLKRLAPVVALAIQAAALATAANTFWGTGHGVRPGVWWRSVNAWSPWSAWFLVLAGLLAVLATAAVAFEIDRDRP
jgi:small subunit ribosomal protein S36